MKHTFKIFIVTTLAFINTILVNAFAGPGTPYSTAVKPEYRRVNILVSSKPGKFDIISISMKVRARINSILSGGHFFLVSASSSEEMAKKVSSILQKKQARIGNLWFDSHGHFAKRYSLIEIGKEEFSYKNIRDTAATCWFSLLSPFSDSLTRIGLGSCYSGATYETPAIDRFPSSRMNGDSLMLGMSRIFNNASVYGSESWVMSGPGVFSSSYAMSGYPPRKKFRDPFFAPVWERLGIWNYYDGSSKSFCNINTVSLDARGDIGVKESPYLVLKGKKKKQEMKLKELKKGNYNLAFMFQYN